MAGNKRDDERVPLEGLEGEVMVFQPMTVLDISVGGAQVVSIGGLQSVNVGALQSIGVGGPHKLSAATIGQTAKGTYKTKAGGSAIGP